MTIPDGRRCELCNARRVWFWSMSQERYLLRRCECKLPRQPTKADATKAREALAAAKARQRKHAPEEAQQ